MLGDANAIVVFCDTCQETPKKRRGYVTDQKKERVAGAELDAFWIQF